MVEKRRRDQRDNRRPNGDDRFKEETSAMNLIEESNFAPANRSLNEVINSNASPSTDDFDWDTFESTAQKGAKTSSNLDELFAPEIKDVAEKVVIKGKVVALTDRDVVLDIGFKSDGMVPIAEFKYMGIPQVGDEVEVLIESKEDKNGQIIISHKKAQAERSWDEIVKAHEEERIVQGYIKDRTKGGMIVDLMGLDAFLPGSQIDVKPIKDYEDYVGKTLDLKIVKINNIYRNIVVSHKAIIESDLAAQKVQILGKLEKGQVLEGIIKNLTSFGVFVDLGGVDGLIHITDVSWGRINHPEEVLEVSQKINVVVLDYDEEKQRISLGMKQLTPHPWVTLPEDVIEGSIVTGKVVNLEDYGAFIEIAPGVEGLVHVSEMSWSTHLKAPQEYVKLNEEVQAKVLAIDREERKLSLGLKQLSNDPWANIDDKYNIGTKHHAIVRSMTNFGLFVELEEGIDGLVHISDLSWTKKFSHPAEFTKPGEALDVIVLDIDKENKRLSLGHKQLEEDPWDTFESIFLENSLHQGVITSIEEKGAVISLPYGVEAFAPKKHLAKQDKSKPKVDETMDFRVIEFDKSNKKIIVSHTDIWKDEERKVRDKDEVDQKDKTERIKKDIKKVKSNVEKSTLADELDILSQLKSKMEEEDKVKQQEAIAKMDAKDEKSEDVVEAQTSAPIAEVKEEIQEEVKTETPTEEVVAENTTESTEEVISEDPKAETTEESKDSEEEKA